MISRIGSKPQALKFVLGSFSCTALYNCSLASQKRTVLAKTPQQLLPQKNEKQCSEMTWSSFWEYLRQHWLGLFGAFLSTLAAAYFNVQIPVSIGSITSVITTMVNAGEAITFAEYWEKIKEPALRFAFVVASQAAASFATISMLSHVMEGVAAKLRHDLFDAIQRQNIEFFEFHRTGELSKRINQDVQELKSDAKKLLNSGIKAVAQTAGVVQVLYGISPTLTASLGIGVGGIVLVGTVIGKMLKKHSIQANRESSACQNHSYESLSNIKTVRAFSAEDKHLEAYDELGVTATASARKLGYGIGIFQGLTNLALNGLVGGTVILGGSMVGSNQLSGGDLMAFLAAVQMLQKSLATVSQMLTVYMKMKIAGDQVFQFISLEPGKTVAEQDGKRIPHYKLIGNIAFDDVDFSYATRPDDPVLKKFNLQMSSHKVIALVGASGNGKSTIASLLARMYDPSGGKITIDGVDIRNLDPKWLRGELIGYVGQEPALFTGTVADNIRYGKPDASDLEIEDAARRANCHEFITSLKNGYFTKVAERGSSLSGGQKQRIAIARAIIKNPEILIFDEATSALDNESEAVVQRAIEENFKNRMVLIIAHRLSTVKKADIIHVVEGGKIVESGNHEELMRKRGVYFNLQNQQSSK